MFATAVATYVIAFNLKRISELYRTWRKSLVDSMLMELRWIELGEGLKKSSSDEDNSGPSEWWVIIYFIQNLFPKIRCDHGGQKGDGGTAVGTIPDGHKPKDSGLDNVGKSGESPPASNEHVPKQPLSQERDRHADGSKNEGENSEGPGKETMPPPKKSWFPLSRRRVPFSNHSKNKEPDIEGQKSGFISETDTGNGKGKGIDMAGAVSTESGV
jgi:hypothetical protein